MLRKELEGIIIVNKPAGWTSFDVVAKIRSLTRVQKVGHSGTLDPMATGVLPVFLGRATKSIQNFLEGDKGYVAEMTLGISTDTQDAEGKVLKECPHPKIGEQDLAGILPQYRGEQKQFPPMYSAVKHQGRPLYQLARKGKVVERRPRNIKIYKLELLEFKNEAPFPRATLEILCSKGTYIRQLISDLGDALGCGAHQSKLQRIYAHPFRISETVDMDTIITLAQVGKLDTIIIKPTDLKGM